MFNHVGIMGRFAQAPELKHTQNGSPVTSFTLAADRDFKNESGSRDTDWIDCVAWRGTAEFIAKHFQKGQSILVSGRLQTRGWTDKDGSKRRSTEVLVESAYFAGASPRSATEQSPAQHWMGSGYHDVPENDVPEKEGIPF